MPIRPRSKPSRRFVLGFLAGWCLLGAAAAPAAEPLDLSDLGAPSFESFTSRDGLPDGVLTAIGVDAEGFAWVTSPYGLYRFVGHRWQRRLDPAKGGTVHFRLTLDSRGRFWAPSADRGVTVYRNGAWEPFDGGGRLDTENAYRISELPDEQGAPHIWLLTQDAGLFRLEDGGWVPDPGNDSLPDGPLLSMAVTTRLFGESRQWLGTGSDGVWYRPAGETRWRAFESSRLGRGQVEDLRRSLDPDGEALWIAVFGEGLERIGDRETSAWTAASGDLRSNEVYTIAVSDSENEPATAWVASRDGLVRVRGDRVETFDRRHGLPSDQIRSTMLWDTPEGDQILWIATEGGAARAVFTGDRWRTVTLMGAGTLGVFGLHLEPDGRGGERLWVASTRDGLGLYERGRWRTFSAASGGLPYDSLRTVQRVPDLEGRDTLWLGMSNGDLVRVEEGPRFETVRTPWPKPAGQTVMDVLAREVDGQRELWVATRLVGIHRWREDGWTSYSVPQAGEGWRTTAMVEQVDRTGRSWLWASSSLGLARFDGERWTLLRGIPGLPDRAMIGLTLRPASGDRQVLWIGTSVDGLVRLDVTDPEAPTTLPASDLPAPIDVTVYGAELDSRGRIYLCTNVGVQQLTPRPDGGWEERSFGRRDGMVHEECNTNAQLVDAHDRFWTGTLGGLTVFDPGFETPGRPKKLRLVGARVDNRDVSPENLRLEPGGRELQVEFTLQSWQREQETRYRTQVIGFHPRPGPWTEQPTRSLGRLPPGQYRLRIEGRDYSGLEAEPLELPFSVVPAWWQRRSVQAFGVLGVLLVGGGVARWRTRRLLGQKQRLEAEVAARTEELNAANARLQELSYTDALTGLANRRRMLDRLQRIASEGPTPRRCGFVFVDVDFFKEYNDRLGHPAGDEALCAVAANLVACAPPDALVARYGGEEFACLLLDTPLEEILEVAETMRVQMAERRVAVPGSTDTERLTISAGVAAVELVAAEDIHRLLREADRALYRAKSAGRNCVRS